jgi:hypothetical protein
MTLATRISAMALKTGDVDERGVGGLAPREINKSPADRPPPQESELRADRSSPRWVTRRNASTVLMAGTALAVAGYRRSARAQAAVQLVAVDIKTIDKGYRASRLLGRPVENDKNQKIGTLDDLIIGQDQALFGVLQVGAFLGLGGHLIAVPYDSLNITDDGRKIILAGASKEALGKLPEYQDKK